MNLNKLKLFNIMVYDKTIKISELSIHNLLVIGIERIYILHIFQ